MSTLKRQDLPRGLWVVATPIGNLGDLSERARAALAQADAILCEDTRRTANLLAAIGIRRESEAHGVGLIRLDAHASQARIQAIVERLGAGESFALVTDAGTPGISDPGAELVREARLAGVSVTPVPGPSALTAFLSIAGIQETSFTFRGFFPRGKGDRVRELNRVINNDLSRVFIWFESPERIIQALSAVAEQLPDCHVSVTKELSKLYEKFFTGTAPQVLEQVTVEVEQEGARGEWCFLISLGRVDSQSEVGVRQSSEWVKALQCLIEAGISAADSAKRVSRHFDVSRNEAYESALRLLGKKI